ncbi:MAG: GDP-mannose 4,6-dehydratase [Chloroflexi bacterium]|nr:GDP-mannose 4,6-dehydratase [Chloroflexota bacterium]
MRILITGVGGFVGGHLSHQLHAALPDADLHGTTLPGSRVASGVTSHEIDLKDERAVHDLLAVVRPDHIYHLAAQASPRRSFTIPWDTLENNIRSQLNLFLACLSLNLRPRILVISSAEIYGAVRPEQQPLDEDTPLRPNNPYAVSKVAQDMLGLQYYLSHRLPVIRVRPFNHFGPGQSEGFVAPDFAMQIARIEAGLQEPVIHVGNLSAERDFTDVRDVVRAYTLLLERGVPGEVYNVASGSAISIQTLLATLLQYSRAAIEIQPDAARLMPVDTPVIRGDAARLHQATGWQPTISFEQSLRDLLDDCRQRVTGAEVPATR